MKASQLLLVFLLLAPFRFYAQDAREIVKKADDKTRGLTSKAIMKVQTIRPTWNREMSLKTWSKGNDMAMILVTAPSRDKGTVFLKRKKEVWNWIPSIERTIKLPPSMMSQSWMGTDFTNDDLVKEASIVEDYHHTLAGEEQTGDRLCYKIQLLPRPEAAVVWGKIIVWIDKKDYLMLKVTYYDEEGSLVSTMVAGDIKMLGGKILPSRMEMIPEDKKGNKTVLIYEDIVFDQPIDDKFFSSENMERIK